jgi:hypothetical protein
MDFPYPVLQPVYHPEAFDCQGQSVQVYDFVRVVKLPDWYLENRDDEGRCLREIFSAHTNCLGMIRYSLWQHSDGVRRWFGVNKLFVTSVVSSRDDRIVALDVVLNGECVERIAPNFVLSTLFANYGQTEFPSPNVHNPHDGLEIGAIVPGTGRVVCWPIGRDSPTYEIIGTILETPIESLVSAHEAVLDSLCAAYRIAKGDA